jgi:uncharacterized membrane protein YccC
MEKKGYWGRLKVLSRPTGDVQWVPAIKAILLMFLSFLLSIFLGLDKNIPSIMFLTLIASIIIEIELPIRKLIPIIIICFLAACTAFISSSIVLDNLILFLIITALWTFFSFSVYIFGGSIGYIGFTIFLFYFLSVLLVNNTVSTYEWALYVILAFLVALLALVPKLLREKSNLLKMITAGFEPQTSLSTILVYRETLSGLPLDNRLYELFRVGVYLTTFRSYGSLLKSRISGESLNIFKNFMISANQISSNIAEKIKNNHKDVDLSLLDQQLKIIDHDRDTVEKYGSIVEIAHQIRELLGQANNILKGGLAKGDKIKIINPKSSAKEIFHANFNLQNVYIRHAIRFALAMTIALLVVRLTNDRNAIWITMGVFMILKPDVTSTLNNLMVRVTFNFIAIVIAILVGFLFPHQIILWLGFIMIFFFRAFFPNYMSLSVMAMTLFIVFLWPTGTVYDNAIARIVDIGIGAVIAFVCAYLILPSRVTINLPIEVAKTIKGNIEYAQKIFVASSNDYKHQDALQKFRKYMLAENNLEAAIRKMEDTFNDISGDISIYKALAAANNKIAADLSVLATSLEYTDSFGDFTQINYYIKKILDELSLSVEQGRKPSSIDNLLSNLENEEKNLGNKDIYLGWISSDLKYLREIIIEGVHLGALDRYRALK